MAADEVAVRLRLIDELSRPAKGAGQALRNIGQDAGILTQRTQGLQRATLGLGTSMKGLIAVGAGFAGGRSIFGTVQSMQGAEIGLTNLLGSAERAKTVIGDLQMLNRETPLEFPDLLRGTQQLLNAGMAGEDVVGQMRRIADIAAATGDVEAFPRISRALSQMQSRGRIQAEELLQLSEAGVPALRALANAAGVTQAQLTDMSQKGLLDTTTYLPKLLDGLENGTKGINGVTAASKGLSKDLSGTLAGAMSNLTDAFGQGVYQALDRDSEALDSMTKAVRTAGEELPGFLRATTPLLQGFGKALGVIADNPQILYAMLGLSAMSKVGGVAGNIRNLTPGRGAGALGGVVGSLKPIPVYVVNGPGDMTPSGKGPGAAAKAGRLAPLAAAGTAGAALTAGVLATVAMGRAMNPDAGSARALASEIAAGAYSPNGSSPVLDAYRRVGTESEARAFVSRYGNDAQRQAINVTLVRNDLSEADVRELGRRYDDLTERYVRERRERASVSGPRSF